jgi:hypothetical protein
VDWIFTDEAERGKVKGERFKAERRACVKKNAPASWLIDTGAACNLNTIYFSLFAKNASVCAQASREACGL